MLPGNNLKDNWFMCKSPNIVHTLKDLIEATYGFNSNFKLRNENGNHVYIRMGDDKGIFIIDGDDILNTGTK